MENILTIKDLLLVPLFLVLIWLLANNITRNKIDTQPHYKYFKMGLMIKIFAGFAFAMVYLFYYGGGDTFYYFLGSQSVIRLATKDFLASVQILFGDHSLEVFSLFDGSTGWPTYWRDVNSFAVCRFNVPFYMLSGGSFLANTLIMNFFFYIGIWRFYNVLICLYPKQEKWMAYALFCIPSVVFWGSGILKDGWTLVGIFRILSAIYYIVVDKQKRMLNVFYLMFWCYVVFSIRPFMMYATLASSLLWLILNYAKAIKSRFLSYMAFPFIVLIVGGGGAIIFSQISSMAGDRYSDVDTMIETAWIIQDDLKQDYYGGNTFDIGAFDPTIPGVIKMVPKALLAGLFRPYIWEMKTPFMLLSGIENFVLMLLTLFVLFKRKFYSILKKDSFLLSILVLSLILAFAIGLTTANFGSLVRYVIPVTVLYGVLILSLVNNQEKHN